MSPGRCRDAAADQADEGVDAEFLGGLDRVQHLRLCTLADTFGVAVAPHPFGQDAAVPLVDRRVADRLADQVRADRPAAEAMAVEQLTDAVDVAVFAERPVDLEMVAPGAQFEPVVAHLRGDTTDLGEGEIGPLSREECDVAIHACLSSVPWRGVPPPRKLLHCRMRRALCIVHHRVK